MQKRSQKEWMVRLALLLTGLAAAQLGVTMFLLVGLGTDPFNLLVQGLSRQLGLSHGTVYLCVCLALLPALFLADPGGIRPGTLLCAVCGGGLIDLLSWLFAGAGGASWYLPVRILVLCAACMILAFGTAVMVRSDTGERVSGLTVQVLSAKLGKPMPKAVLWACLPCVGIGWCLGGTLGVGTLLAVFAVRFVSGYFYPAADQMLQWVLERCVRAEDE